MQKITIQSNADFTPHGKRTARIVTLNQGQRIRWYVGGRIYDTRLPTPANVAITKEWLAS